MKNSALKQRVDYILINGNVITVDNENNCVEAIAIGGNTILATGSNEYVLKLKTDDTEIIDCENKTVIPGIIDSHTHLWEYGILSQGVITFGIKSIDELKKKIAEAISGLQKGEWLQGGSWIETQFVENRMPTRWDLDEVSPDNPVVIERIFGACVVNSAALKLANINKDTPDPLDGTIERDENMEPTGVLQGQAVLLVREVLPGAFGSDDFGSGKGTSKSEEYERYIKLGMPDYVKYGITSIVEPGVSPVICKAYQDIRNKGELNLRVNLMPNWHGFTLNQQVEKMDRYIKEVGIYSGFGDEWLRFGGLKMAIDGGLTSKTAILSWPYLNESEPREGRRRLDLSRLDEWIKTAHDAGWSIGIHVMGDIAIEMSVNAIYKAYKENPIKRNHHIIHAYYPTEDSLAKMKEAGIMASVQGSFTYGEADGYNDLLTKEKQEEFLPLKTYNDSGIITSLSSDTPCAHVNPFLGLYSAITRKGMQGYCLGTKECISVLDGIRMLTLNGAYITNEQDIKGSLEPGKLADICILDRNILECDVEEIKDIEVKLSILDGRVIYNNMI